MVSGPDNVALIDHLRQALADAQVINRALEIEAERQRVNCRALEAALAAVTSAKPPGASVHIGDGLLAVTGLDALATQFATSDCREASFLLKIADLTDALAHWQGKYDRQVNELDSATLQVNTQARRIDGLIAEVGRMAAQLRAARELDQERLDKIGRLEATIADLCGHEP